MTKDPLALIDPSWRDLDFEFHMIQPGDEFPLLDGVSLFPDVETMPIKHLKKAALSPFHNAVFGVGVACPEAKKCWYVPLRHRAPGSDKYNVDVVATGAWLRDSLARARLIGNGNLKFDAKCLETSVETPVVGWDHVTIYDPIVAATLIDERIPVNLQHQAHLHLGLEETKHDELEPYIVGNKDYQDWSYIPADLMARHNCGDTERACRLSAAQLAMLKAEQVEDLMRLEMGVSRDLMHMELRGHRVDVARMEEDLPRLYEQEIRAARRIEELVGASMNYESPAEIAEAFITRLALPILSHKPGRDKQDHEILTPVFDDAVLQTYGRTYPQHAELMFLIRKARRMATMKSFVQAYLEVQVHGVIHTTIKQVGARTGRESSEMPNLQNITGEEEWDDPTATTKWVAPGCEKYFLAREGHTILSFDYSQVEYRFFAHYLKFQPLLDKYRNDPTTDLHQWAADEVLHGMLTRDDAKSANFGVVFGMGDKKLVRYMATNGKGITEVEAAAALDFYYRSMPLEELQKGVGAALTQRGFVRSILGRRRRITKFRRKWGEKKNKKKDLGLEPYQALNFVCQGGGVDLLKHRAHAVRPLIDEFGGHIILKVHDDVKVEVPTDRALECARRVLPELETFKRPDGTDYLLVPIYAKCTATETSWYDARKLELRSDV